MDVLGAAYSVSDFAYASSAGCCFGSVEDFV